MLTIPTLDIGVTSRAFLQDHRRKSYLQPINWSVLSSGDTPYVEPMEENFLGFEFLVRNEEIDGHSHEE